MFPETQPSSYYTGCNQSLLGAVPPEACRILDVGCAEGQLGAALKHRRPNRTVFSIERQPDVAARAAERLDRVYALDVATDEPHLEPHSLDCLLFGDILEHLVDPEAVLRRFQRFLAPGGVALASIPNLQHHTLLAALLSGDFQYAPAGLLDATHLRFLTGLEFENRDIADFPGGLGKLGPAIRTLLISQEVGASCISAIRAVRSSSERAPRKRPWIHPPSSPTRDLSSNRSLYSESHMMDTNSQPSPEHRTITYTYDRDERLIRIDQGDGPTIDLPPIPADQFEPWAPAYRFEHDKANGIFRLTGPDGSVECFRHNPTRYLVVEPDAQTSEMTPVLKRGRPTYLYLCREEREVR